ncbi:MFS transporter [Streptomyces sp. NPDC093260]|uniref:MFS transporter n=1 Tax=Streptomyces sp. NPDC093260 TaxID=3155073 RepID=UPI003449F55C
MPEAERPAGPGMRDRALSQTGPALRALLSRLALLAGAPCRPPVPAAHDGLRRPHRGTRPPGGPPGRTAHEPVRAHRPAPPARRRTRARAASPVLRERLAGDPALPPGLLRSRALSGGTVIGLLFDFGFYGMVFTASVDFQRRRGLSALETGAALFPAVAMTMFASALSGRLSRRTGDRPLVVCGMLLAALGLAGWAPAGPDAVYPLLVAPMMAAGFGASFALTGATATVMGAAPPGRPGVASALFNTARQIGSATGVALGGSLLATAAGPGGLRTGMAAGALACLIAAALAWRCVPAKTREP